MQRALIAPSILAADWLHLEDAIRACESAGADWLHVDVMDGRFVPNLTMGPFIVEHLRRATALPLDVHLMVEAPGRLLDSFADAGATYLTVHVETCPDLREVVEHVKKVGCKVGVTLNPGSELGSMDAVLPVVDLVLVMSVQPGYSGQGFLPGSVERTAAIRRKLDVLRSPARLAVDGGITAELALRLRAAGADVFVAASAVFRESAGIAAGIRALREATDGVGG